MLGDLRGRRISLVRIGVSRYGRASKLTATRTVPSGALELMVQFEETMDNGKDESTAEVSPGRSLVDDCGVLLGSHDEEEG